MIYPLSDNDISSIEKHRQHFDAKTQADNDLAAQDYIIDGKPISEELYHNAIREPLIDMLEIYHGCDVLDIGCGTGLIISHIEDRCKKIVGVDISETLISRYKGKAEMCVAAAHEVDYPPESFDRIYMLSVAIHFPSFDYFKNVVERCLAMLRPNGIFIVSDQILTTKPLATRYLAINKHELIDYLDGVGHPYSIRVQNHLKRSFSNRYDIVIYKDKKKS
jgi:2-polyprenyl-3-methyl-5-hydroxy-6-metoxy-1,4-benzoquinol methylase